MCLLHTACCVLLADCCMLRAAWYLLVPEPERQPCLLPLWRPERKMPELSTSWRRKKMERWRFGDSDGYENFPFVCLHESCFSSTSAEIFVSCCYVRTCMRVRTSFHCNYAAELVKLEFLHFTELTIHSEALYQMRSPICIWGCAFRLSVRLFVRRSVG